MRIVVSGATSMIGSALANKLIEQGHEVIAIVREKCKKIAMLVPHDNLSIVECNMDDYILLDIMIRRKIDVAVATAWDGTRGDSRNDQSLQQGNFQYNMYFLKAMIRLGCKKFLTSGSQAEYGLWSREEKLKEEVEPEPNTEYGKYKLKFYEYAKNYCIKNNCVLVEPRFFSLYGPNDFEGTLVISTLKKMLVNEPCELTQCIQMWDFLYIDDAIDALCMLIEREDSNGIYNLGSGYSVPLKVYIEKMMEATQSKSELHYGTVPYPKTGVVNVNPDVQKLMAMGWKPRIKFDDGIKCILEAKQFFSQIYGESGQVIAKGAILI